MKRPESFAFSLFLLFLLHLIRTTEAAPYNYRRIIATPKRYKALSHLGDLQDRDHELLWEGPLRNYHLLNLTATELDEIDKSLKIVTGEVDGGVSENSMVRLDNTLRGLASNPPLYSPEIHRCINTLANTTRKYLVFIMDGYINDNTTILKGRIKQQFNLIRATPGVLTHGSRVAETVLGGNDGFTQSTGIEGIGLTVFDDTGHGFVSYMISAMSMIQQLTKQLAGQGYIFGSTLSGNGNANSILDAATRELGTIVLHTQSAGNRNTDCTSVSPSNAGGYIIPTGGTDIQNGYPVPNYNSVHGCGPNMFYMPYCGTTHNFVNSGLTAFCGTSRATPHLHRVVAAYRAACPTCDIPKTLSILHQAATVIDSNVGPISVFKDASTCPLDRTLFTSYQTTDGKYSPQFNATTPIGKFCATFKVTPPNKSPAVTLLFSVEGTILKTNRRNKLVNNEFTKKGYATFVVTSHNAIGTGGNKLNLLIETNAGIKGITHAFAQHRVQNISVSTKNGIATFSNARACLLPT